MAAQTVFDMCQTLCVNEEVSELIWSIVKVTLSQETSLLIGRHLDQIIMCAIYGVCKVHPNSVKISALRNQPNVYGDTKSKLDSNNQPRFNDIIDAYKDINKQRLTKAGCWQLNIMKSSSVSWVYIEVPLDP